VLPLKFAAGRLNAPGKIMFDTAGNVWIGDNFIAGSLATDGLGDGNQSKIARTASRFRR